MIIHHEFRWLYCVLVFLFERGSRIFGFVASAIFLDQFFGFCTNLLWLSEPFLFLVSVLFHSRFSAKIKSGFSDQLFSAVWCIKQIVWLQVFERCKTNRFHVGMGLFSDRPHKTSK